MSSALTPARVVPPGRIILRELEARGWSQKDLAEIMGRPPQTINEIVKARKQITPDTACQLAAALGASPQFWLNLESNYRLHQACAESSHADIARRSRLYSLAPVPEMIARGWIEDSTLLEVLERRVCDFLGLSNLEQQLALAANLRHTATRQPETAAQVTWIKRVEHLAGFQHLADYDPDRLHTVLPDLLALAEREADVAAVPSLLMAMGVHFVIVPHLPQTYLDGAALALAGHPIVALTLRYDRIDSFWFTLLHELGHIIARHPGTYLDNLDDPERNNVERAADQFASSSLLDSAQFDQFVHAARPRFSKTSILEFAQGCRRHPGIVVGRLHHAGLVPYSHHRSWLSRVKPHLEAWLDTPGPTDTHIMTLSAPRHGLERS